MALMAELMLQAFVRALAWARGHAWAAAWGVGRPVGPDIRGACLRIVGSSGGWISGSNGVFTFIIS